ncbi:hypothetical protein FPV16_14775 [Methylobacterium sp. W2]|uniref:hypothetical protein n=1 Tax=Methylobacterium sp. W2 TaxID=2598107 RepID=UPI001D0C62DA|nr:hypothetical protein [Methylobacterium sp. W2]MCC0807479.1 hypothetical protein [Methylobacterium sp. W2]
MNIVQRAKANVVIATLRMRCGDAEVFEVLQSIARTDADFVAKQTAPTVIGVPASREAEDIVERALEGYIRDRTDGFRRDGADESATNAYSLAFVLAFHDAIDEAVAQAIGAPAKTPSGLPAIR